MNLRESFLYVGMDLHKDTHTAVMANCWNEKLETIVIENKPSEFGKLAKQVNKKAVTLGLSPIYGLENAYGYGRSLAVWLIEKGYTVKDINPALAYDQRKSAPTFKKNDEYDAYCVATVMINQLNTLPDAKPEDNHWTLSQLVNRRDTLINDGIRLKNGLHEQVSKAGAKGTVLVVDITPHLCYSRCGVILWCAQRAHVLQGESPEACPVVEGHGQRQGCPSRGGI